MPKIEILEQDLTTPGAFAEDLDVIYVPGLVNVDKVQGTPLEPHKPYLFNSVSDFEALCGTEPVTFNTTQRYTDLNVKYKTGTENVTYVDEATGNEVTEVRDVFVTRSGFPARACPVDRTMFNAGDADPGYVMAKHFLGLGMSVLFERINPDILYERVNQPEEETILANPSDYAMRKIRYKTIDSPEPPVWKGSQIWALHEKAPGVARTATAESAYVDGDWDLIYRCDTVENDEPSDWTTSYTNYVWEVRDDEYSIIDADDWQKASAVIVTESNVKNNNWKLNFDTGKIEINSKDENGQQSTYYLMITTNSNGDEVFELTKDPSLAASSFLENAVIAEKQYTFTLKDAAKKDKTTYRIDCVASKGDNWSNVVITDATATPKSYLDCEIEYSGAGTYTLTQFLDKYKVSFEEGTIVKVLNPLTIRGVYDQLPECYSTDTDRLLDKGNYSVKYLTSGGYPTYEYNGGTLVKAMCDIAEGRGDCVALIDHTDNIDRPINTTDNNSVYSCIKETPIACSYAAMFTPWCTYGVGNGPTRMPASFAYLTALSKSIRNANPSWLAIAGSARGKVTGLSDGGITTPIPNSIADAMQPRDGVSINAITNIKPYGPVLWGNRTLATNNNLVATSLLSIRNLVSDIKKVAYMTARKLTFEQNSDILWVNFKGSIAPTLDRMVSGYGISGYKIVRDTTHAKANEKATLCAKIIIYPIFAVEDFYITVTLKDDEVSVE